MKIILFITTLLVNLISINAKTYTNNIQVNDDESIIASAISTDNYIYHIDSKHKNINSLPISLSGKEENYNRYVTSFVLSDKSNPKSLYVTRNTSIRDGIYISKDSGENWFSSSIYTEMFPDKVDIPINFYINLDIDPLDFNKIYIRTVNEGLFSSDDGGKTFRSITESLNGLFFNTTVNGIFIHPNRTNELKIVTDYGIFKSNNYGETWDNVSKTSNFFDISQDLNNENVFYAIDEKGKLFKSIDSGLNFNRISNIDNARKLRLNPNDGQVYFISSSWDPTNLEYIDGLYKLNYDAEVATKVLPAKPEQTILDIQFNKNYQNKIYLSTFDKGITIIDKDSYDILENIVIPSK